MPLLVDSTLGYLTLSIGGRSLTISPLAGRATRVDMRSNEAQYSAYGTPAAQGIFYESEHKWEVECFMTYLNYQTLMIIREESDRRRRAQSADWRIVLDDTTLPFPERSPRTRAKVAGTDEDTDTDGDDDYVIYFPRFYAWMPQRPIFTESGQGQYMVSFSLMEVGKFLA